MNLAQLGATILGQIKIFTLPYRGNSSFTTDLSLINDNLHCYSTAKLSHKYNNSEGNRPSSNDKRRNGSDGDGTEKRRKKWKRDWMMKQVG